MRCLALGRIDEIIISRSRLTRGKRLWQAYREHAFCLAGRMDEALRLASVSWPVDIYEWVHHFETLVRLGRLDLFDARSFTSSLRKRGIVAMDGIGAAADSCGLRPPHGRNDARDLQREYAN